MANDPLPGIKPHVPDELRGLFDIILDRLVEGYSGRPL
jgi:hypothetical protein